MHEICLMTQKEKYTFVRQNVTIQKDLHDRRAGVSRKRLSFARDHLFSAGGWQDTEKTLGTSLTYEKHWRERAQCKHGRHSRPQNWSPPRSNARGVFRFI